MVCSQGLFVPNWTRLFISRKEGFSKCSKYIRFRGGELFLSSTDYVDFFLSLKFTAFHVGIWPSVQVLYNVCCFRSGILVGLSAYLP